MLVVRKLDRELLRALGISKFPTFIITCRSLCMTVGADDWLNAFEELLTMAANTGSVIGKVGNVRKASDFGRVRGRRLMASFARLSVFFGGVRESRVIDCALLWRRCRRGLANSTPLSDRAPALRELLRVKDENE